MKKWIKVKWIKVEDIIDNILAEEIIVKQIKYYAGTPASKETILLHLKWDYNEHYYNTIQGIDGWQTRVVDKIITTNEDKIIIHVMSEEFSKHVEDDYS